MNQSRELSYAVYVCTRGELKMRGMAQGEKLEKALRSSTAVATSLPGASVLY